MKILNAKGWQVFMITYGVQFIVPIIVGASRTTQPFVAKLDVLLLLILVSSLFWWLWNVAHKLQDFIPALLRISTTVFNIAFIFSIIYLVIVTIYVARSGRFPLRDPMVMIPHILSIICFLYLIGFAAKVVKTAETNRSVVVNDYFGEICQIFFFPIGVWLLQPRINRIVKSPIGAR